MFKEQIPEEKGFSDFGGDRKLGSRLNTLGRAVNCNYDLLVPTCGDRERVDEVNAHNVEGFVRSGYIVFETGVEPSVALM